MRLAKFAAMAAMAVSALSTAAVAAPVRPSDARLVSAPSGVTAGVLNRSQVRASKKTAQNESLLGAPLFLLFLGAVAVTVGTIVIVDNNGSN